MDKDQKGHPSKALIVVRLRGGIKTHPNVRMTFIQLRLNKVNHCVVIPKNANYEGMLQMVKDYTTWGEADPKTLAKIIQTRGKLVGDKPITDEHVKSSLKLATIADFASAITQGKVKYSDLKEVKPLFRLHPPVGGLVTMKRSFKIGGDLGYRGDAINDLVLRMLEKPEPRPKRVKDLSKFIHKPAGAGAPAHEQKREARPEAKPEAQKKEAPKPKTVKKVAKVEAKGDKKAKK